MQEKGSPGAQPNRRATGQASDGKALAETLVGRLTPQAKMNLGQEDMPKRTSQMASVSDGT